MDWKDKELLEKMVLLSKTRKEVLLNLKLRAAGSNFKTLSKYLSEYDIDTSHFTKRYDTMVNLNKANQKSLDDILIKNSTYCRGLLKKRLYKEGLKERRCEKCGQGEEWRGRKMSLILDHINGVWNDNRLSNLRIVCPNCNATLDTHCGKMKTKNKQKAKRVKYNNKKYTDSEINKMISSRKVKRPDLNILLSEVKELGYSGTGRKYGVSDNAIRKWISFYNNTDIRSIVL